MNNLLKKIIYFILSVQEKSLTRKLNHSLKGSYSNKTSKTVFSGSEHMTLTLKTEKHKQLVKKNVEDILKTCENNPQKLLDYINTTDTKVYKINHADKLLQTIGEEEGLICELTGIKALYLNICTNSKISLKSKPMFVLREGQIDPLYMIHHFYKWYSLKMNLPGFDFKSQQNFKKYLKNPNDKDITTLSLNDILGLQEAIARDQEATTFCLEIAQKNEGARNVKRKMSEDGGANI
ncbi:hypothetical protein IJZ97_05475 [bacterium]|nr:hypothetical protein [bacterium]